MSAKQFEFPLQLSPSDWRTLLEVARHAIKYGLTYKIAPALELDKYNDNIKTVAASFVTLKESNVLRGCIGSVFPHLPLVQDVANHAYAAAFQDSRFKSINHIEEPVVHISVSVLSKIEPLSSDSERALAEQIESLKCGVILRYQDREATLLPECWEEVSNGLEFLGQLKQRLGLSLSDWNTDLTAAGYLVQTVD